MPKMYIVKVKKDVDTVQKPLHCIHTTPTVGVVLIDE